MMTRPVLSRTVLFAPGPAAAWWGWGQLHQPFHLAGLGVLAVAGLITWPLIVLAAVFGLPAVLLGCWPRSWRRWWRNRHPSMFGLFLHWAAAAPVGRDGARSAYIPTWLMVVVFAADRRRCVYCHSRPPLNADHVMPWSLGGLTVLFNLMTLCQACNLAKSNAWIFRRGGFWPGHSADPGLAEQIITFELRHRWNILRWLRAAWALGG